ncbi:unnamed protein product, partial [Adineta steineri]
DANDLKPTMMPPFA